MLNIVFFCQLLIWTNKISTFEAEASAIRWTLELAIQENYLKVIVESNPKFVWTILMASLKIGIERLSDSLDFALRFVSCFFSWVKRETNIMAHALVKFVLYFSFPFFFFCNKDILLSSVLESNLQMLSLFLLNEVIMFSNQIKSNK